jgi:hypothetical protein
MELPANRPWVSSKNLNYQQLELILTNYQLVICFARLANSACRDPGNANLSKFANR